MEPSDETTERLGATMPRQTTNDRLGAMPRQTTNDRLGAMPRHNQTKEFATNVAETSLKN